MIVNLKPNCFCNLYNLCGWLTVWLHQWNCCNLNYLCKHHVLMCEQRVEVRGSVKLLLLKQLPYMDDHQTSQTSNTSVVLGPSQGGAEKSLQLTNWVRPTVTFVFVFFYNADQGFNLCAVEIYSCDTCM